MARISTYNIDNTINDYDLLAGSNYLGTKNGVPGAPAQYSTRNFKLKDLAEYFATFWLQDGSLYDFSTLSQNITTNATAITASASDITALTSTVTTQGTTLAGHTTSIATANSSITTNATAITSSASDITSLTSTVNTQGTTLAGHTTSIATANTNISTNATNVSSNASSVTSLTSNLALKPDVFRQDDPPAVTKPVGSIWYDTNDNNKVYVLVAGSPNVWTESTDGRIVTNINSLATANSSISTNATNVAAEAAKVTELKTQFTYSGDNITGVNGSEALNTAIDTARSTAESASATKIDTLGAKFYTNYNNATGAGTLKEAFANSVFTTTTNTDFAAASDVTSLTSTVTTNKTAQDLIPLVYRQDDAPAITVPINSLWYDTNDGNKLYLLKDVSGTNTWTATIDATMATNAGNITTNATTIAGRPKVFRQDAAPGVTEPVNSVWYDTNADNKPYILVAGDPNVWTETADSRVGVVVAGLATANTTIGTHTTTLAAEALLVDELQAQFTYSGTDINGVADALNTSINSASSTAAGAVATDLDKLEAVFTQNSGTGAVEGITGVLSTAVTANANTAITNASLASAADVTELKTQFSYDGSGNIDGLEDTLSTTVSTAQTNAVSTANAASTTKVNELASAFFTGYDPSDQSYTGVTTAFANEIVDTETSTDYASATSVTNLTTTVGTNTTGVSTNLSSINGVKGKYGVTINANGALTGYRIIGDTSGASSFIINANDFKIYDSGGNLNPFSVSSGKVQINGDLNVSSAATIGGTATTNDANGRPTALMLKNLGAVSGNEASVAMEMQSASRYHHVINMTGGGGTSSNFDLSAEYRLGKSLVSGSEGDNYSFIVAKMNGAGLIIPNQTANSTTVSADYLNGMNIIFNDNAGSRTINSGRLHVSEYFKTFFLDIPANPLTSGDYANRGFSMRKYVTGSPDYEFEILYVKPATNSLHVVGDIVAAESSDKRLKDNIKPIKNAIDKIEKIGGYEFDWNDKQELYEGHDVGVIAQEIEKVLPEVVETRADGYKAVDYKKIIPLLIQAIKEQQKQIDELSGKNNNMAPDHDFKK